MTTITPTIQTERHHAKSQSYCVLQQTWLKTDTAKKMLRSTDLVGSIMPFNFQGMTCEF